LVFFLSSSKTQLKASIGSSFVSLCPSVETQASVQCEFFCVALAKEASGCLPKKNKKMFLLAVFAILTVCAASQTIVIKGDCTIVSDGVSEFLQIVPDAITSNSHGQKTTALVVSFPTTFRSIFENAKYVELDVAESKETQQLSFVNLRHMTPKVGISTKF
jgi:hypothetical protein